MKKYSFIVILLIFVTMQNAFAQETELVVSDEEKIILFSGFIIGIVAIFLYLARDIILRKKTMYDSEELESKKDKTYEKYHSGWSDDFEEFGKRKDYKEEKEFSEAAQNSTLPNYYKILKISQDATQEKIKEQYRKLAKESHPDKNKEATEEIMVEINKAYEVLSDEESRKRYDKYFKVN